MFGLPKKNVRVITKFVGSGFGSKLFPWTQCPLAAAAARQLGKPVKLVVSRKMMFQTVGHRPRTQQRVRLGATADGKLLSFQHDYLYHRSMLDDHHEDCGESTAFQYSVPNLRVTFGRARRNVVLRKQSGTSPALTDGAVGWATFGRGASRLGVRGQARQAKRDPALARSARDSRSAKRRRRCALPAHSKAPAGRLSSGLLCNNERLVHEHNHYERRHTNLLQGLGLGSTRRLQSRLAIERGRL